MLGAFDFAQYANASTRFGIGDQVLLYTDGLAEGSNDQDEEFGIERLKGCFDGGGIQVQLIDGAAVCERMDPYRAIGPSHDLGFAAPVRSPFEGIRECGADESVGVGEHVGDGAACELAVIEWQFHGGE